MIYGLILLAGKGERLNHNSYKQYLEINGKCLYEYSLDTFIRNKNIDQIVLVVDKAHTNEIKTKVADMNFKKAVYVVTGGSSRQESVFLGLEFIKKFNDCSYIVIHDAARPLVSDKIISDNVNLAKKYGACTTYLPMEDTVYFYENSLQKGKILNRDKILKIQTPQSFKFDIITLGHSSALLNEVKNSSDDVQLVKQFVKEIGFVIGSKLNFKITNQEDLEILKQIIEGQDGKK